MHGVVETRRARISGQMAIHNRPVGADWVVTAQGVDHALCIDASQDGANTNHDGTSVSVSFADGHAQGASTSVRHDLCVDTSHDGTSVSVSFADGHTHRVVSTWTPGDTIARVAIDADTHLVLKVDRITQGFRIRFRGADLCVRVRTPRQHALAALMPASRPPPDTARKLLCPMPGLVVRIAVQAGETVQEGQTLCVIEAMKMENVLRAEGALTVARIEAHEGDTLGVDAVIMTFAGAGQHG